MGSLLGLLSELYVHSQDPPHLLRVEAQHILPQQAAWPQLCQLHTCQLLLWCQVRTQTQASPQAAATFNAGADLPPKLPALLWACRVCACGSSRHWW